LALALLRAGCGCNQPAANIWVGASTNLISFDFGCNSAPSERWP